MRQEAIIIPKVWRSELHLLVMFLVFCVVSVFLSRSFPASVIKGELFRYGNFRVFLYLPLFWFLPACTLGQALWKIYNVRYLIDSAGIECRTGILSFQQTLVRIRYIDIRSAEIFQTLTGRFLSVGTVLISTAAKETVEIVFSGIAVPQEVQEVILAERDKRQKIEGTRARKDTSRERASA